MEPALQRKMSMKDLSLSLRIAAVFIGTVVGAGLASGQEIIQFFTRYGFRGTFGIAICGALYIVTGSVTVDVSYRYGAASYRDLIYLSCGKYLGLLIDGLTTFFIFGSTCIIMAGSGSIFSEYLGLPFGVGVVVMASVTILTVLYSTNGLIFINSLIVPCMISITVIICISVFLRNPEQTGTVIESIRDAPAMKSHWFTSSIIYMAFNMLGATGVLAPMTVDIRNQKSVADGVILGAVGLTVLTFMINTSLLAYSPGIFKYSIPMLHLANGMGRIIPAALSVVIWLEMFSTAVSNVYSLSKKMHYNYKINYKLSVVLIALLAIPFSGIGFVNLINLLYPPDGVISFIYICCLTALYLRDRRRGALVPPKRCKRAGETR